MLLAVAAIQVARSQSHNAAIREAITRDDAQNSVPDEWTQGMQYLGVGFDPGAPLDALQRFVYLAYGVPLKGGRATVSPAELCNFWKNINAQPEFKNSAAWKAFLRSYGEAANKFLPPSCGGQGALRRIEISSNGGSSKIIKFVLNNDVSFHSTEAGRRFDLRGQVSGGERFLSFNVDANPATARAMLQKFKDNASKSLWVAPVSDYKTFANNQAKRSAGQNAVTAFLGSPNAGAFSVLNITQRPDSGTLNLKADGNPAVVKLNSASLVKAPSGDMVAVAEVGLMAAKLYRGDGGKAAPSR